MNDKVNETVSAGAIGSHAVATAPSRLGAPKKRDLKSFLVKFYDGVGNKLRMHPVPTNLYKLEPNKKVKVVSTVNENFNLDSVLAQLSNFENKSNVTDTDVVTYGVEDDKGNLMKVTILNTQGEDFESYISAYLSELKNFENSGVDIEDISLAELLYKLKDLFDIRDVEFPNIPEDVVYNADEASDSVEDLQQADEFGAEAGADDEFGDDEFGEFGDEGEMGDDEFGEFGDEGEMGGEEFGDDEFGDEGEMGDEEFDDGEMDEFSDDESVEDFEEMGDESSPESLLADIIDMLKAQAMEQTARHEAEAEKYRADQAEYTARATEATLSNKEEIIAMQAEKDKQKDDEKAAKKQADLATYRYKKGRGMLDDANPTFEGFDDDSLLMSALLSEEDIITDPLILRRKFMAERRGLMAQLKDATSDGERQAIQKQLQILPRKFMLQKQEAEARGDQKVAMAGDNDEDQDPNRPRDPRAEQQQQQQQAQSGQFLESSEGIITETISEEEYDKLDEGAKRQFKRYGNKFVRKFRCYGGPKDGRMVSKAADCGIRKDPFKVRQGKRSARRKKGQRVRKTRLAKRKAPSKRVTRMNKIMRGDKRG